MLRLQTPAAMEAKAIKSAGFSGVILPAEMASKEVLEFVRRCRAVGLGCWIDLSELDAPDESLHGQRLVFEKNQPRFLPAEYDSLDILHPRSGAIAVEILESFSSDTPLLTDVTFQPTKGMIGAPFPDFPWSPGLPESFLARHNFNILHRIETLVSSGGDEASRIRQQYWDEVYLAHETHFLAPIRGWCAQQKVAFHAANDRAEWAAFSLDEVLPARLNSAATALEGAGGAPVLLDGQETRIPEFHRFLRTGATAFEREHSAELNTAPDILFNEIIAREAGVFHRTRNAAKIGVLFPGRSAQTHYHPDGHRFTRWVGEDLGLVTDLLDGLHFDWMFVSEEQISTADRDGNALSVGAARHDFEMIVLPSVTALSWECWQKLEAFADGGGKVACLGLLPRWSERGRDRALEKLIGKDSRLIIEDLYQAYDALEGHAPMPPTIGYPVFREYHSGGRLCCYQPRLNADAEDARLRVRQILHESLSPTFETLAEKISYAHRTTPEGDVFFVLNEGEEAARVNARLRPLIVADNSTVSELDMADGVAKKIPVTLPYSAEEGGGIGLAFELAAGQARFFEMHAEPGSPTIERASFEVETFDGETAAGWMTQNGPPQVALRQAGKITWHEAEEDVVVPAPLLLDGDEWNAKSLPLESHRQTEYSQGMTVPADWKNCRVFLDVAASSNAVQCLVNGGNAGLKISPPFRFEVTLLLAFGASNDFTLRVWQELGNSEAEDSPPARLVAYPRVEVKIKP